MNKLVIFGVGLIGGSAALALRRAGSVAHITGVGRSGESLLAALESGVIDSAEASPEKAVADADMVLIAAPVAQTPMILASIAPYLDKKTVVTDAGSTKNDVVQSAAETLGSKFPQFVPGHPIAGAEKSGVTAARADLFAGKNVVLTPADETSQDAVNDVTNMWRSTGAIVSTMSAEEHDSIFAAVSHLPHLLAFALVDNLASRTNAAQLFNFAASGFRDFTRIAGSSSVMWRDISLANRDALLKELEAFEQQLSQLKTMLKNKDARGLQIMFERASKARSDWGKTQ